MQANYRINSEAHPVQIWILAADCLELAGSPMPARNPVQHRENKFHFLSTLDGVRVLVVGLGDRVQCVIFLSFNIIF